MSKMRHVPIDDALRQFRFNALNTPLVAKDMTTLDKEMSDILSRTDLSKESKLKKYYEILGKFQEARNIFKGVPATVTDASNQSQIMETIAKKNEETKLPNLDTEPSLGLTSLFDDVYDTANSILDDGNVSFTTPTTINTSTPSRINNDETPRNSRSSKSSKSSKNKNKSIDLEREKNAMKDKFLSSVFLKNDAIRTPSPSRGGRHKTVGYLNQVDHIFDYLFSKGEESKSPKFAGNRRNNMLTNYVVNFLKPNAGRNWEQKYPVLKKKFSNVSGTGQKNQQRGFGKVKINYKQWDYLNKKLNL